MINKTSSRGFTLIAALLLLMLMSAISIGLFMMVTTETKVGGGDAQNNIAFHNAEGAIEMMNSQLANSFQSIQSPSASQICAISTTPPATSGGWTYPLYSVAPSSGVCTGRAPSDYGLLTGGTNQGLYAQIIPITMQVTAQGPLGQQATMMRTAQVALIPAFQFGAFSDSDLDFFSNPTITFNGRVHTNGDLYIGVAGGNTLTFGDKITAYGNVVTGVIPNGLSTATANDQGTVYVPNGPGGCTGGGGTSTCNQFQASYGSWTSTTALPPAPPVPPAVGTGTGQNAAWYTWSTGLPPTDFNGMIKDGNYGGPNGTGVKKLSLPFIPGGSITQAPGTGPFQYEIVRRPPAGENAIGPLGSARLYNLAQIRILLSDDPTEMLSNPTNSDGQTIRLANVPQTGGLDYTYGVPTSVPSGLPALTGGGQYTTYFAAATTAMPDPTQFPTSGYNCKSGTPPTIATASGGTDWPYSPKTSPVANTLVPNTAPMLNGANGTAAATITPGTKCTYNTSTNTISCPASDAANQYPWASVQVPINQTGASPLPATTWNLLDGYLRVEYKDASGNWVGVTQEWLGYGFARDVNPATVAGTNPINPNAILVLQQLADRNGNGNPGFWTSSTSVASLYTAGTAPSYTGSGSTATCKVGIPPEYLKDQTLLPMYGNSYWGSGTAPYKVQSNTMFNWYPINFYDTREGEARDVIQGDNSCTASGVMNAVEVDVGNLQRWLNGSLAGSGTLVDSSVQNGYILYFSDRRGMRPNPNGTITGTANTKTGDSGLEDTVNSTVANGTPNNTLEAIPASKLLSPEDVNQNGLLDSYGAANLGLGFRDLGSANYLNSSIYLSATTFNQFARMNSCSVTGRKNWVSGARHVLKLVDGGMTATKSQVPMVSPGNTGGFTVASENPVYIQGDYNTTANDALWTTGADDSRPHAAAGIIADAVTVLSNNWQDSTSMVPNTAPTQPSGNRTANTTYYRTAIAAGKNMNMPFPAWANANPDYPYFTDGGVGNFLRFIEDWNNTGVTLNYEGSLVSLYYSTYATGMFKCCTYSVYTPPRRNYVFDPDFAVPSGLPPGTPMFRDVDSLSYRQYFNPRSQ
jgi:Tfp pilus assembly protein PilX